MIKTTEHNILKNITFLRSPNDREKEGVLSLLAMLMNTKVVFEGDDIPWP